MAEYKYKAMDAYGKINRGLLQAKNEADVEYRLENQGYDLISCKPNRRNSFRLGRGVITRRDLINMVFHLEQLTKSGVALIDGLSDLRDTVPNGYFRDVLTGLVEAIESGNNFSSALAMFPSDFDEVFVALISVGEESGELPKVLKEMGEAMRWADELLANTKKILMYPAIVAMVVLGVSAFLMVYLVPKIVPFVSELGGQIPTHTLALIAVSDFFVDYWWAVLIIPPASVVFLQTLAKARPEFALALDSILLRLPLIGPISFKIRLARFATYMALLYGAGVTVLRSLEICEAIVDNRYMARAIAQARNAIAEGRGISDSFSQIELFPPLVIRMLKVGESTGNLDDALLNVSYFYNREVQEAVDTLEPAISPILTVIMGVLLGWIMMSVLGPVWDAVASVG